MALRYDPSIQPAPEFREVFCNHYVTGFSTGALLWTVLNVIFGLDLYPPLDIKSTITDAQPSIGGIIGGIIVFIIGVLILATFALHNLNVVLRRLFDRLYLIAGRPLASVEGKTDFDTGTEVPYHGIQVGELYFKFDDCWLDVKDDDLEELDRAGGSMRIWYIPTGMRRWNIPRTDKLVKYNCTLVRAEWRNLRV